VCVCVRACEGGLPGRGGGDVGKGVVKINYNVLEQNVLCNPDVRD
jgi:hypothetical protein